MSIVPATGKLTLDGVPLDTEDPSSMTAEGMRWHFSIEVPESNVGVAGPGSKECAGRGERSTENRRRMA